MSVISKKYSVFHTISQAKFIDRRLRYQMDEPVKFNSLSSSLFICPLMPSYAKAGWNRTEQNKSLAGKSVSYSLLFFLLNTGDQ